MKNVLDKVLMVSLLASQMAIQPVWAGDEEMQKRITRLERIVKGQGLVSLLGRVDQLQNEVQRLNGDNETLRHQLETMKRRQREMYIDLDGRLQSQVLAVPPKEAPGVTTLQPVVSESVEIPQKSVEAVEKSVAKPVTKPDVKVQAPAEQVVSPVAVENGEAAYQAALQTLRGGQYEAAIAALSVFPKEYPQSSYLPNAYYWQGEANYVLRNFDTAITAFQTVIEQFPVSSKVADAILKQGFSQYELGQVDVATQNLEKVIAKYPTTSAARLAKVRLERIQKEAN
jgi:tol-pal system protein YbgF